MPPQQPPSRYLIPDVSVRGAPQHRALQNSARQQLVLLQEQLRVALGLNSLQFRRRHRVHGEAAPTQKGEHCKESGFGAHHNIFPLVTVFLCSNEKLLNAKSFEYLQPKLNKVSKDMVSGAGIDEMGKI